MSSLRYAYQTSKDTCTFTFCGVRSELVLCSDDAVYNAFIASSSHYLYLPLQDPAGSANVQVIVEFGFGFDRSIESICVAQVLPSPSRGVAYFTTALSSKGSIQKHCCRSFCFLCSDQPRFAGAYAGEPVAPPHEVVNTTAGPMSGTLWRCGFLFTLRV